MQVNRFVRTILRVTVAICGQISNSMMCIPIPSSTSEGTDLRSIQEGVSASFFSGASAIVM